MWTFSDIFKVREAALCNFEVQEKGISMTGRRTSQAATLGLILMGLMATPIWGQKFYLDDPLEAEPPPMAHTLIRACGV